MSVVMNEERHFMFQVAEVSRPLTAVSATHEAGHVVVYGPRRGVIRNVRTGERTQLKRHGRKHELYFGVLADDAEGNGIRISHGFVGQGR